MTRLASLSLAFLFAAVEGVSAQSAGGAAAAPKPTCSAGLLDSAAFIVVFDAAPNVNGNSANTIFSFVRPTKVAGSVEKTKGIGWLLDQLATTSTKDAAVLEASLSDSASVLSASNTSRWISQKGDRVLTILFYQDDLKPTLKFNETARSSRIESDLSSLIQLGAKMRASLGSKGVACTAKLYTLQQQRANLAITGLAASADAAPAVANAGTSAVGANPTTAGVAGAAGKAANPPNAGDKTADTVKTSLVTGRRETLFLSANAGVTNASQVTYDDANKALGPAKTPKSFYIAANWSVFQDLYEDESANGFWDEFVQTGKQLYLGALVEGSTRPFNQFGAFVGFRWLPFISDVISVKTVSPFVGVVWAKSDTLAKGSTTVVDHHYGSGKALVGLSLNLSQALSWVGGGTSASGK